MRLNRPRIAVIFMFIIVKILPVTAIGEVIRVAVGCKPICLINTLCFAKWTSLSQHPPAVFGLLNSTYSPILLV